MQLTNKIKSITIGSFDGIHLGHQVLINQVEAVVVIERNSGYLTSGYRRSNHLNKPCFFYHFEKIHQLSAKEFVEKLCIDFPQLETIVVGYDFGFGHKKEGNTDLLTQLFHGEVVVVDEVKVADISVHSRTIKHYLKEGNLPLANQLLGRSFRVEGEVVSGQGLGKKELVPTINLNIYDHQLPKNGVYVTRTKIENKWLESVSFVGIRQTTDGAFAVETYVLNNTLGEVNGRVTLEFLEFIRENRKFNGLNALKTQINLDITYTKNYFKDNR